MHVEKSALSGIKFLKFSAKKQPSASESLEDCWVDVLICWQALLYRRGKSE